MSPNILILNFKLILSYLRLRLIAWYKLMYIFYELYHMFEKDYGNIKEGVIRIKSDFQSHNSKL